MSGAAEPATALSGIRVLDLSRVLAGPWASQILGDLGAEVWKIEKPGKGDDTRGWGPPFLDDGSKRPDAAYYLCCNRNKMSVAVDFATDDGAALVRKLALQADVVIENFRPGTLAKYGLDAAGLMARKPSLIYCSITGFGQSGPYAQRGGYDFLIQGMSGLMSMTGRPDGEAGEGPLKVGLPVCDLFTGFYAAISILGALAYRSRTGEGQRIDCSLLDSQLAAMVNQAMNYLVGGDVPRRLGNAHPNVVPYRDFRTADGHIIVAVGSDEQFHRLCGALDRPDLADEPRYRTNAGRARARRGLEAELSKAIAARTSEDMLGALARADVPSGPINTIDQILSDPHVAARGLVRGVERPDGTAFNVIGFPSQLSRTPARYERAPPRLGADTQTVLRDVLSLDDAEIARLDAAGVIGAEGADHDR